MGKGSSSWLDFIVFALTLPLSLPICDLLRLETQQWALTPAIAVTAIAEKTHEVLSHGFQCLLQKPLDVDELVNEMVNLLEQSKLAG